MTDPASDESVLRRLLLLFAVLAGVCLLAGASRMCPPHWQLIDVGGSLRIREALSMFVFAPAIGVLFWMLCRTVGRGRTSGVVDVLLVLAIYFVACGMGIHDPANRMQVAYREAAAMSAEVRQTLVFLDDGLSHWVFWGGFVLGTWVLGIQQALSPLKARMVWPWRIGLGAVAAALLWVMLTNLWDEYPKTRVDLCVIALAVSAPLAVQAAACRRTGLLRLPVLFVIYPAYFGAIAGTLICWLVRYGKV